MTLDELSDSNQYFNRELSQLQFSRRVLSMAKDPDVPLLERLRYLTITSGVLDEFFEIRVAVLKEQVAFGTVQREASGAMGNVDESGRAPGTCMASA